MIESKLKDLFVMRNKNLLVSLLPEKKVLNNGINLSETKGRKDIVVAIVEVAEPSLKLQERCLCYFPMYAASPVEIDGRALLVVNYQDVIMTDRCGE